MSVQSKRQYHGKKQSASRHCKDKSLLALYPNEAKNEKKILSCDTEDNSKGTTIMVNFFDGKNHYTFRHTEAAVEWLIEYSKKYKKGVEVWFANTQYDIGNLFRESQEYLSFTISGSRFITGKIYQERISFKDILNVIPGASVKSLGKMIGLEKIEVEGEFDNEEYCQRDTEIVYWALLKFKNTLEKLNVELKNTAASTGFHALLSRYSVLSFNSFNEDDHAFMNQGYYGGRTEVFHTSKVKGEIYGYDIVSSYPYSMCSIPLVDVSTRTYTKRPRIKDREGMAEVLIEAPEKCDLPYLPVKFDQKLIFPRGEFRGVWTYFELREAQARGYKIKKCFKAVEFKSVHNFVLRDFVEKLFKIRAEAKKAGDDVLQYACKIILNASYGKFAMGNEKSELVAFEQFHKIKGSYTSELFPNNQIIVRRTTRHSPSTNFLTAALITAYGRHNLYKYLSEATKDKRKLLYCDTDSIFFHGKPFDKKLAPCNGTLGSLQLEYEIKEAQFILPKTYMIKLKNGQEKYKCKGVREKLAEEFFKKGFAESMQPLKYVETCRKNFFINERNKKNKTKEKLLPFNLWVNKPKSLKSSYTKRNILKSGATSPIKLKYNIETEKNEYY